mmetsp:Transcript_11693/g.34652  ORF Transcript_11693/g.34652 Transcript_11693/m.34652 type:complete len:169 (-) Transcript_11693:250-756(-)
MGLAHAERRERKRLSRVLHMRNMDAGFYKRIRPKTLLYLARKEGVVPGVGYSDVDTVTRNKELVRAMQQRYKRTHINKNLAKAVNTRKGKRVRALMGEATSSALAAHKPSAGMNAMMEISHLASSLVGADGSDGQSVLCNAMCGIMAAIPVAVATGVAAAVAVAQAYS